MPPTKEDKNFRARRLSVSDIDTSEFDAAKAAAAASAGGSSASSPPAGQRGRRERRMSMSPEMGVVKAKQELPFSLEQVGTYSCHGVEPGMRAGETSAKINQDRGCVCYPFGQEQCPDGVKQALFCVYDGHGALGDKVSHFVMYNIEKELAAHPKLMSEPAKALHETFVKVDKQLQQDKSIDAELSGTTAVVLLIRDEGGAVLKVWAANVGDSRAVWSKDEKTKDLSEDQKPDTPAEMARIKSKGGFVSPPEEEWGGPARVWLDANMTLPGLAMARSIGDHLVSSIGVFAEPVVEFYEIPKQCSKNDFIVMASDGVWEFIESEQAVKLVNKNLVEAKSDSTVAVTKLIETAAAKWRQEEGDYRDDITAIVIRLQNLFDGDLPK